MAGRRLQHLERREGTYYLRLPIPADLVSIIGRRELRWSLRTRDGRRAGQATLAATVAFREFCAKMRSMIHAPEDALRAAIREFFAERLRQVRTPGSFTGDTQDDDRKYVIDRAEQRNGVEIEGAGDDVELNNVDPTNAAFNLADERLRLSEPLRKLDLGDARALSRSDERFQHGSIGIREYGSRHSGPPLKQWPCLDALLEYTILAYVEVEFEKEGVPPCNSGWGTVTCGVRVLHRLVVPDS